MAKPADIIEQIVKQLQLSPDLNYVSDNAIFKGTRESIAIFPAIIVEPLRIDEVDDVYGKQELTMRIVIGGFVSVTDKDKQLVGSGNIRGILDIENDIKKVISADRTLAGKAIHTRFITSLYDFTDYPVRSVGIEIEVVFRQDTLTRN